MPWFSRSCFPMIVPSAPNCRNIQDRLDIQGFKTHQHRIQEAGLSLSASLWYTSLVEFTQMIIDHGWANANPVCRFPVFSLEDMGIHVTFEHATTMCAVVSTNNKCVRMLNASCRVFRKLFLICGDFFKADESAGADFPLFQMYLNSGQLSWSTSPLVNYAIRSTMEQPPCELGDTR